MHNAMRKVLLIVTFFTLATCSFGQNKLPKNLKQAVRFLDKDCLDIVKDKIKIIHEDSIIYAVYPYAKTEPYNSYETISNWTSNSNGNLKIKNYLEKKGIYDLYSEILLFAFRQYLLNGKINENQLFYKTKLVASYLSFI